jgi:hypothetical protein
MSQVLLVVAIPVVLPGPAGLAWNVVCGILGWRLMLTPVMCKCALSLCVHLYLSLCFFLDTSVSGGLFLEVVAPHWIRFSLRPLAMSCRWPDIIITRGLAQHEQIRFTRN